MEVLKTKIECFCKFAKVIIQFYENLFKINLQHQIT
jgi:hypothetical protein